MNSLKKRALAILLSAVTLASSMMSATSVFADELSKENGTIYADIKGVGGTVSIEESENKTSYYLDDSDEVKLRDSNNSETVAVSDNDNYNVQYDSEVGTTLTIKVVPDIGYKVSEYSTAIDGGDAQSSLAEDTVEYSSQITVSGTNQYISVNFEEVKLDDNAVYSLPDVDFSSCRLLVGSDNEELFTNCSNVLSSYEGVYLLQFESEEATKKAYISLLDRVEFVNVDTNDFSVADIENVESDAMSEEINPINELAKTEIEEVKESNVIAVIDTGSSERANVIERVSVLGDNVEDDNGHGDKMISKILSQDENAKIISIKAMDSNGKGTTSSVYAGLKYAIEKKVDIINMSFVGIANEDNTCIEELVKEAIEQGITVVGSAGNNGVDASEYIPGCIEEAYIIGAANADGERLDNSNYGGTVDYNVVANSTSEAASLFTGYLSKNNKAIDGVNSNGFIFDTGYVYNDKTTEESTTQDTVVVEPEITGSVFEVSGNRNTSEGQWVNAYIERGRSPHWLGGGYSSYEYKINGRVSFCLRPKAKGPVDEDGNCWVRFSIVGDKDLKKAMYYYWTGNTLDVKMNDLLGSKWLAKNHDNRFLLLHYACAYLAGDANWSYGVATDDQIKIIKALANYIKGLKDAPSGYNCYYVSPKNDERQVLLWAPPNELTLKKVDAVTGKGLKGAKLQVIFTGTGNGCTGERVSRGTYTTGDDGTVKIKNFPPGNYELIEVKAPPGYQKTSDTVKFTVSFNSTKEVKLTTTFKNTSLIKLELTKKSSVPSITYGLAGAKYGIYTDANCKNYYGWIVTDDNGYGYFGNSSDPSKGNGEIVYVPKRDYWLKELKAPEGYKLDTSIYKFVDCGLTWSGHPRFVPNNKVDGELGRVTDEPFINLQLKKISANPKITGGNSCYSYEGAVYNIYWKKSDAEKGINKRGEIVTDKDGYGAWYNSDSIDYGTNSNDSDVVYKGKGSGTCLRAVQSTDTSVFEGWFVKETKAPKGYELDTNVYQLKDSGKTTSKGIKIYRPNGNSNGVADKPGDDPVRLVLRKKDPYTGEIIPLSGAVFKIEYYNTYMPETFERDFELDTSSADYNTKKPFNNKKVTRTWYIKTNELGYATFDNDWIITKGTYTSGELYTRYDEALGKDVPIIPYGTIIVTEVKSPDPTKYQVSTTAYYRTVDDKGIGNISTMELDIPEPRTPELDTVAVDSKTKSHSAVISKSTSITDTITYVGLHPTKTYTMKGWVVEKSTGTIYSGVSTKTFTPDNSGAGTVSLTHTFASDGSVAGKATLAGKSVVAFAQVIDNTGAVVAEHKDLNDADQTVSFIAKGEITTKADFEILYGKSVKYNHPNSIDRNHSFLYDNVYGYGLEEGTYYLYTMVLEVKNGVLVKENGKIARPVFWNDNIGGVTYNQPYHSCTVVTNSSGAFTEEIEIEFNGDFSNTDGKSYVVFEFLSKNNLAGKLSNTGYNDVFNYLMSVKDDSKIMAANHTDPKDSNQTINFKSPKITTEAYPYGDKNRDSAYISGSKNETTIIESVKMENLNKGINYCLKPYVYVVENGKRVLLDESIAQKVKVYNGSSLISKNSNGTPFILNSICEGENFDYSDTADRTGAFTFSAVSETQTLSLKFDFSECKDYLKGKTVTFGEMLITEGRTDYYNIAEHNTSYKDATTIDANQTVNFIEATVSTKAISDNTGASYAYALGDSITITDKVKMTGLIPGKSYNISGSLVDESGKTISGSAKSRYFTATVETQTVDMVLTLKNPSNFVGKKVVAYEKLYHSGYMIASHTDIDDTAQTINVLDPTVTTVASTTPKYIKHSLSHKYDNVTCYDTVSMTGLIKGKTYTLNTQLVNKDLSSEDALETLSMENASSTVGTCTLSEDKKTVSVVFTASSETQDIQVTYSKVNIGYGNVDIVVVDDLIYNGNTIVSHRDLGNTDQTLEYVGIGDLIVHKSDSYNGDVLGGVGFQIYSIDDKGTETTDDDEETLLNKVFSIHGAYKEDYAKGVYYCADVNSENYTTLHTRSDETSGDVSKGTLTEKGSLYVYNLPVGKYRLVETDPLPGYEIDIPEGIVFEIKGGEVAVKNLAVEKDVTNTPIKVSVSFIKTDDNPVESEIKTIGGAGFTIYSNYACTTVAKDFYGKEFAEVFTDNIGIVSFSNLAYSKTKNTYYYLKETTTPEGYVPLDYKIRLTVNKDGKASYAKVQSSVATTNIADTYKLYEDESHQYFTSFTRIINKRGSVELNKINENSQPLDGSKWELYKVDKVTDATTGKETTKNTLVVLDLTDKDGVYRCNDSAEGETVLSTNDSGKLKVENLPLGDYYFQEVKAPEKNIYDSKGLLVDVLSYMPYGDKIYFSLTAEKPDLTSETSDTKPNGDSIVVKNNLSLLPKTGGFGDGLVYIAGISFLLIASIIFALCGVRLKKKYKNF